ncbi:hypothetical protein IPL68_07260 [Candidatus Saccharibacteria bacterium]|nr:MAG: hypothetical protein IPL68_07260 [Candidatus Saccharibacteria bacterium]
MCVEIEGKKLEIPIELAIQTEEDRQEARVGLANHNAFSEDKRIKDRDPNAPLQHTVDPR